MAQDTKDPFEIKKLYLKRYSRLNKRIKRLENKLISIDNRMQSTTSGQITDMPRGGRSMTMDDLLAEKEETFERIDGLVEEGKEIRKEIISVIDTLEYYKHAEVLERFFLDDMSLEEIAEEGGYTVRHTIRLYTDAIRLIDVEECQ